MGKPDARTREAYADSEALAPDVVGELFAGELVVSSRPAPRHAHASSGLGALLVSPFGFGRGGPGGWRIPDAPELRLGKDVVVPDLGGWRLERRPALPDTGRFALAPDWACELLSDSTLL